MVIVGIPISIASIFLVFLTTHSGGILFRVSLFLVPGLWYANYAGLLNSELLWPMVVLAQIVFWFILIIAFNYLRMKIGTTHNKAH